MSGSASGLSAEKRSYALRGFRLREFSPTTASKSGTSSIRRSTSTAASMAACVTCSDSFGSSPAGASRS
jgi:hypothetical protein